MVILISLDIFWSLKGLKIKSPLGTRKPVIKERPLVKYEYETLKQRQPQVSEIRLEKLIKQTESCSSYLFSYTSEAKKITGLANIPQGPGLFPVIVQLRGWVDKTVYEPGVGTRPSGEYFCNNGFVTLAPDYLGYGQSDQPPPNVWEERFLRLVNVLDLLESMKTPNPELKIDPQKIGLWGHSNGGLAALTTLELSGGNYPTALWAPVSTYFPYDVLYYTWEAEDRGKALRSSLAEFEKDYDTEKYSFDNYLDWIKGPIQLHIGEADPYIPLSWPNNLVNKLKGLGKEVIYYTYPGADHNLSTVWNTVVVRDVEFFRQQLSKQ